MDEVRLLIKGKERETYSIHYSCNGFYYGDSVAPTICAIAMTNLKTLDKHVFALHNYINEGKCLIEAEKQLLTDFANFFNKLKNPILMHWKMDNLEYGFKAIVARCENYGIYDISFSETKNINLDNYFYRGLHATLEFYKCSSLDILGGKDEIICFNKRNFNAVKLSTIAKSVGLVNLINYAIKNGIDFNTKEEDE
ncbi:MAG: hypothetical protein E7Z90_03280 [Cyanobacteria bacterium SIG29]|nr:hypothetical protein [Cyanobacteria bacterium SIG29]